MYHIKVLASLDDRLDAEFYNPAALRTIQRMEDVGEVVTLGSLIQEGYRVVYHGTDSINGLKQDQLLPFLSPTQIDKDGAISFEIAEQLPKYYKDEYPKGLAKEGELLVEVKGNVSKVAVVPSVFPKNLMISGSLYKASINQKKADTHYVLAFLKSASGQVLKDRLTSNTIINYIAKDALYSIPVFKVSIPAQKYIGEKVRQAERLRAWAKELQLQIKQQFDFLVKEKPAASKFYRTSIADLEPYRINPGHYDPVVLSLLKRASGEGVNLKPISELLGNRKIAGGATPKGADYLESGVLFGRVQNVKPLALDLSDAVFIDADTNDQLSRSECQVDDIVLSITGYPGTASLVTEQDLPMNINQHSVRFNVNKGVDSAYVCAALNSEFLKLQVQRLSIGGTRDALDFPSVGNLLIPRLSEDIENAVAVSVRNYIKAVQLSKLLTFLAKTLVEELIKGNISEAELVSAQQALEAGDESLDRALLERMTAEGIDADSEPLFDDIDQLYDLLEQAKQALDADDTMAEA